MAGNGAASFAGVEKFDITSGEGNDNITGGDGDDIINTGTGDDEVFAGGGSDYIYGNGGDTIDGGEAGITDSDTLNLGLGNEANTTIVYTELDTATGLYVPTPLNAESENGIVTFVGETQTLTFTNIENIVYEAPLAPTITFQEPEPHMCMLLSFTPCTTICTITGLSSLNS